MAGTIVMKSEDRFRRSCGSFAWLACLIDVVTKVDYIVMLVFSGRITIRIEVAIGFNQSVLFLKRISCCVEHLTVVAARENGEAQT